MHYALLIGGWILALAWFSRIVEAALGVPGIADISKPQWDRCPAVPPRVSIIVPARNEEEDIEQCLRGLLALDYDNYEVIAVNDRSTDRTGEIMNERIRKMPRPEVFNRFSGASGSGTLARSRPLPWSRMVMTRSLAVVSKSTVTFLPGS